MHKKLLTTSLFVLLSFFAISSTSALAAPKSKVLYAGVVLANGDMSFKVKDNFIVEKGGTGEYFIHVRERLQCRHDNSEQFALGPRIAAAIGQFQYASSPIVLVTSDTPGVCNTGATYVIKVWSRSSIGTPADGAFSFQIIGVKAGRNRGFHQ
jgi:hypothetical protein